MRSSSSAVAVVTKPSCVVKVSSNNNNGTDLDPAVFSETGLSKLNNNNNCTYLDTRDNPSTNLGGGNSGGSTSSAGRPKPGSGQPPTSATMTRLSSSTQKSGTVPTKDKNNDAAGAGAWGGNSDWE